MSLVARWLQSGLTPREGWRGAGAEWSEGSTLDGDRQGLGLVTGCRVDGYSLGGGRGADGGVREVGMIAAGKEGRREALERFVSDGRA